MLTLTPTSGVWLQITQVTRALARPVWSAAFGFDGARIVTASIDNSARIWDTTNGRNIQVLRGHEGWVWSAAFSPDETRVVKASQDGTARIWEVASGLEVGAPRGHAEWVPASLNVIVQDALQRSLLRHLDPGRNPLALSYRKLSSFTA
jgi:WD40 repeat protein